MTTTNNTSVPYHKIDWRKENDVVSFVQSQWDSRDRRRLSYEREWYVNIAFYLGHQWLIWDANQRGLVTDMTVPKWRVRLICNKVQPCVRKFVSKFMRQEPVWLAKPATLDPEDLQANFVSNRTLYYYWRRLGMTTELVDLLTWLSCCGNVFIRPLWDPRKGPEMRFEPQDLMQSYSSEPEEQTGLLEKAKALFGKLVPGGKSKDHVLTNMGDLDVEVCSPFEIDGPFTRYHRFEDWPYLIHSKARSPDYIEEMYGVRPADIPEGEDSDEASAYYERRVQQLTGPMGFAGSGTDCDEDTIVCHEVFLKPCPKYPKGGYTVVGAGKQLKKFQDIPYANVDTIPYVFCGNIPVPGRFWHTTEITQIIALQVDYNRARSQICEIRNLTQKPKILNPKASGINRASFTTEPGEIVDYQYPFKPEAMPLPQFPAQAFEFTMQGALRDIEDVTAQHEVTNARNPAGVRAASAIAQLQEQDDTMIAPTAQRVKAAMSDLGSLILKIIAEKVTEDRLVTINGRNAEIEVLTFKGQNILGKKTPGANYYDVDIEMGSQLPMSRAARQQQILEFVKMGILNPDRDSAFIRRIVGLGTEEPIYDEERLDRSAAWAENLQLVRGELPIVQTFHDDGIHLEVHEQFQKSPQYLSLSEDIQISFEAHKQAHGMSIAQKMAATQGPPMAPPPQQPGMGPPGLEPPPGAEAPELNQPEVFPEQAELDRQFQEAEATGAEQ